MVPFDEGFLAWLVSTLVPAFVGLLVIIAIGRLVRGRYLAAFSTGVFLWVFLYTMLQAANLDVRSGFSGGAEQIAMVSLFVIGVLFFFSVDRHWFGSGHGTGATGNYRSLVIPLLVAFAAGLHGFGEGSAFGETAYSTPSTSLLGTFGGTMPMVSYVLHIALEAAMVASCYVVYARGRTGTTTGTLTDAILLSVAFTVPSLAGVAAGYFITFDITYGYALAAGASIYVAGRLAVPLFHEAADEPWESTRAALFFILGFLCIYVAALFYA